jgi:hypothetical protein
MSLIEKLERKMPWLSTSNVYKYLTAIFLLGLIIDLFNPLFYLSYLSLNVKMILSGQVWRLITFIFYPPSSSRSIILSLLLIYVYYSLAKTLTMMWGDFKFNLYLLIGFLSQIIGAFFVYFVLGRNILILPTYSFFSMIMAFALSFPDAYFYIYFLIPIKAKYFAYVEIALYLVLFLSSGIADRVAIICSVVNVFVFFVLLKNKI